MRVFTAICIPDDIRDTLYRTAEGIKTIYPRANVTRKDNLHLTLVFIGETDRIDDIRKAVGSVRFEPFRLCIRGTGYFRSGIEWAGIARSSELMRIQKDLNSGLTDMGFSVEDRRYSPHLTLAREVPEPVDGLYIPDMSFTAENIRIFKSERIGGKLTYTDITEQKNEH